MAHTVTIEMPDSQSNPDVSWRIAEYVRVLNACAVVEAAIRTGSDRFAYVPERTFYADTPGPKFTRIVMRSSGQEMVHCFIENATGKVIRSAGWKAPAKDKDGLAYRYDLMDEVSRTELYQAGTWVSFYKK